MTSPHSRSHFALEIHRNLRNFGLEMHQYNWFLVWKYIVI